MTSMSGKSVSELDAEIVAQKKIFNDLRAQGAPLDEAKKQLGDLQKALALAKGAGEKEKKDEGSGQPQAGVPPKKKERLLLKTAKVNLSRLFIIMH